jgi:acetyl esterase/lipase
MDRATLLVVVLTLQLILRAQAISPPMTFQEISMLLRNGEKITFIVEEAGRRKILQPLTLPQEAALTSLGATPALLEALRAAGIAPMVNSQQPVPARPSNPVGSEISPAPAATPSARSLAAERRVFTTQLVKLDNSHLLVPTPPPDRFQIVTYRSPVGELSAYLSTLIPDGTRHPAIIWIVGGFSNSISSVSWEPASPDNDQSASAFAKAGIITMFPSLRGGNTNPGSKENFLGEVDDVIAAADFLSRQPSVDAQRIYLGGHSTGGTLALLVAESTDRFRSVFAFGPAANVATYDHKSLNFDTSNPKEIELRSPINWLQCIRTPTFVFEGTKGNIGALNELRARSGNALVQISPIIGATHFNALAPMTHLIAGKILKDTGTTPNFTFSVGEKIE